MQYIKWNQNTFWRQYRDIGICFQQHQNRTVVVNKHATLFLQFLSRNLQGLDTILKSLQILFPEVSEKQLQEDFWNLIMPLAKQGIIYISEDNNEQNCFFKDTETMASQQVESTKRYLDNYFQDKPQLMSLQIEITPNCNLQCVHCYLGFGHIPHDKQKNLSTESICHVIDEFARLGGLHITFTGGEVLLNKDLIPLLDYARKKDLSITLLTNGTLFTEGFVQTLCKYNLAKVQLSLYSMVETEHDAITQIPGSCNKTKKAVELLLKYHIPVQLACVAMKENQNSFVSVMKFAQEHNLVAKVGNTIQALENFGKENLKHRIDITEAESFIRKYFDSNPKAAFNLLFSSRSPEETDFVCGLGHYALNLNAQGKYTPCAGFNLELGNIHKDSLYHVFYDSPVMQKLRKIRLKDYKKCCTCEDKNYCDLCPGKLYSESGGDMFKLSDYFCEVAHINRRIAEEFVATHKKGEK